MKGKSTLKNRRQFLLQLSAALAGGAAYSMLPQLHFVSRAAASGVNDYRALVCIGLNGGNDSHNTLIPYAQEEYNLYKAIRGGVYHPEDNPTGLAIARDELLQITDNNGKQWGLHPSCAALQTLFNDNNLAFVANVGTLMVPTSKFQYEQVSNHPLPPELHSHNDQQRQWRLGHSNSRGQIGWGGLVGESLHPFNTGYPLLPPSIAIDSTDSFVTGNQRPFTIPWSGSSSFSHFSKDSFHAAERVRGRGLQQLLERSYESAFVNEYASIGASALTLSDALTIALDPDNGGDIETVFPTTNVGRRLRMIARLIKVGRDHFKHHRQVFYVGTGGYDTHAQQMEPNLHAARLVELTEGMLAFRNALVEINADDQVNTFTLSEFGRTLTSNGSGTDHGWGASQWVMGKPQTQGGSLDAGRVIGQYPILDMDGDEIVNRRGFVIPSQSTQAYGATFARWMGIDDNNAIRTIFNGIDEFDLQDLGFLS